MTFATGHVASTVWVTVPVTGTVPEAVSVIVRVSLQDDGNGQVIISKTGVLEVLGV